LFIYDFLFGFLFLISGIKLLSTFLSRPMSSRGIFEKRAVLSFFDKNGNKKYRIFLETDYYHVNDLNQTTLSPMLPDLNYIDFVKLRKKDRFPVYLENGEYYYDSFMVNAKIGLIFIFISILFFLLSIYEFFSVHLV